jgi:hypothetical protein
MLLGDYNEFKPAGSDFVLPIEEAKGSMRYRHALVWEVDLFGFGIGAKTKSGSWTLELITPDGTVIFKQVVTLTLQLVSLSVPGLNLFVWNYVKDTFETTIIGGETVTKETIGPYLLGGTAESEQGDMQPASGESSTDLTATIISDWYSPVYLFEIPEGTKFEASQDSWGSGSTTRSEYQWAFGEALTRERVDAMYDPYGQLLIAADEYNSGNCFFAIGDGPEYRYPIARGVLPGLSPAVVREEDGTLIFAALDDEGFREYATHNYFLTREPMLYADPQEPTTRKQIALWPKSATMATLIKYNESRASLAVVGGEVLFRLSGASLGDQVRVCKAVRGLSYGIAADNDGTLRVFSSKGLPVAKSGNAGRTWEAVNAE